MNTRDNARSKLSRQRLRSALLALLETRELSQITVAQLCREAGLNRSTFYAHYENLWDVLEELEQEMDGALLASFAWVQDPRGALLDERSFLTVTRQIASYPAFFRARFNNSSVRSGRFSHGMDWLMEQFILPYARSLNDTPLLPYYAAFGKAGILEVLRQWLENDCRESAEDIAHLLYGMLLKMLA